MTHGHRLTTHAAAPAGDKLARWRPRTDKKPENLGRFVNVEETARRHGWDVVRPLLDAALTGDDLALEVVEDMSTLPGRSGRMMFEQALERGIETVADAPASLVRLFEELDNPPEWVDFDQLRRGSIAYFRPGPLVPFSLTCANQAGSMRAYGITRTVVFSGRLVDYAAVRARETARWIVAACGPEGMRRYSEGFKLTVQVRLLHAMTRRGASRSPNWDWDDWGLPLADVDTVYAVSYDFTQTHIDAMRRVGIRYSDQEIEDFYALFRYIGHVLGVPDHLLHRNAAHARQLADVYLSMDPGADEECRTMLHSLIKLSTPEDGNGMDMFPPVVAKLLPPLRMRALLYGFTRYWMNDDVAARLTVPDNAWKHAPRLVRPLVGVWEAARKILRLDDARAAEWTLAMIGRSAAPQDTSEQTLAPHEEQEDNVRNNGRNWGGDRGRSRTVA